MREEIFKLLKQVYSPLGLGDNVLQAHAEMLDSLGVVTAENMADIVSKQKAALEAMQKSNDSRVSEALKKKAEDDEKKRAKEEAEKKAAEAKAKAEEEAARLKAEEEAKKKQLEQNGGLSPELKSLLEEMDRRRNEELRSLLGAQKAQSDKSIKELTDTINTLKQANEQAAAEKAKKERAAMILNKAKELGIPQSRIDEGFVIADDADENSINSYLGQVKRNIDAVKLPQNGHLSLGEGKAQEEVVTKVADALAKL